MKKNNLITACILLLTIIPFTARSQNSIEEQIIGDWIFDYDLSIKSMNPRAKKHFGEMDANNLAEVQEAYQNRKLTFKEGGLFFQEMINGHTLEANWFFQNQILNISKASGKAILFRIKRIDESLILVPELSDNGRANMLFSQWHLSKVIE